MFNPFSFILVILIFFCFLYSRDSKEILFNIIILTASLELFIEVGYFIKIVNFDVNYRTFSEFIMFLVSSFILINNSRKINKLRKYGFGLLTILLAALLLLIIFPTDILVGTIDASWEDILVNKVAMTHPQISFFVIQQNFQIIIYITTIFAIYSSFQEKDFFRLIKVFVRIIKLFFIVGILEFILKYVFHYYDWGKPVEFLFGHASSTIIIARIRGFGIELTGLTREASHYSYVLFISIVILLSQKIISESKELTKWIITGIILMIFCMAFSAVLYLSALIFIYLLYNLHSTPNKTKKIFKKQLLVIAIIICFLILSTFPIASISTSASDFFSRRIASLIQEKNVILSGYWQYDQNALEWSNRVRLLSIYMSVKAFIYRPILGYGLGTITCHGSTAMMLAGTGLLGLYYWTKFNFYINSIITSNLNIKYFKYAILIFLFVNLFNSFGLRPFTELHSLFFAISISFLFDKRNKNENFHNYAIL